MFSHNISNPSQNRFVFFLLFQGKSCQESAFGRYGPSITRDEVNDDIDDNDDDDNDDDGKGQIEQTFNSIQQQPMMTTTTDNKVSYKADFIDEEEANNVGNYANNNDIGNEMKEDNDGSKNVDRMDLLKRVHRT